MPVCSFCGKKMKEGTGILFFRKDGKAVYYCSRKCEKNAQMKRNSLKLKWTRRKMGGNY